MKKVTRLIVFMLVILLGIPCSSNVMASETVEKSVADEFVTAKFYVLKPGYERPNGTNSQASRKYFYVGTGTLNEVEKTEDIDKIASFIETQPDVSDYISENQTIEWYVAKKEKDGWHVDGEIVEKITKKQFSTVEDMKEADLAEGEVVETLGYYNENDGGKGIYEIVSDTAEKIDDGLAICLNNGNVAKLRVENNTISVNQFGAIGDGKTDCTAAINAAFASGIENITFEKNGEYKVTNYLLLQNDNTTIDGNNSTIFTDNDYRPYDNMQKWLLYIQYVNDVNIENLNFEAKETIRVGYCIQFGIRYAKNITIANCKFNIPETVLSDVSETVRAAASYCNGTVYSAWQNVIIEDCTFEQLSDTNVGGCIGFNDIDKKNCSSAVFRGNKCSYRGHDEMIAIFGNSVSSIEDIKIVDNELNALPAITSKPRTMCFSIGYNDSKKVNNIEFANNKIEGCSDYAFMTFGNATNVNVHDNDIMFKRITATQTPNMFSGTVPSFENNIIIKNNNITIDTNDEDENNSRMGGFAIGEFYVEQNTVTYNVPAGTAVAYAKLNENALNFNEGANNVTSNVEECTYNTISMNGKFKYMFKISENTLNNDINITNNEIIYDYELANKTNEYLLLVSGTQMNDENSINFIENVVKTEEKNAIKYWATFGVNVQEDTVATINANDNEFGCFSKGYLNYSVGNIKVNLE